MTAWDHLVSKLGPIIFKLALATRVLPHRHQCQCNGEVKNDIPNQDLRLQNEWVNGHVVKAQASQEVRFPPHNPAMMKHGQLVD